MANVTNTNNPSTTSNEQNKIVDCVNICLIITALAINAFLVLGAIGVTAYCFAGLVGLISTTLPSPVLWLGGVVSALTTAGMFIGISQGQAPLELI